MRSRGCILPVVLSLAILALGAGLFLSLRPAPASAGRLLPGPMLTVPEPKWDMLDTLEALDQALPPQSVLFVNGTYTGPPVGTKAVIPALNPDTAVYAMVVLVRPESGGGLWLMKLFTVDTTLAVADMRMPFGFEDCFGGSPFVSSFSKRIIVMVNCKYGGGNDRIVFPVNTNIPAYDPAPITAEDVYGH